MRYSASINYIYCFLIVTSKERMFKSNLYYTLCLINCYKKKQCIHDYVISLFSYHYFDKYFIINAQHAIQ